MSVMEEMLEYNRKFVESKQYELYASTKYPEKRVAVLSCMDTRLTELLPAALNFKNGQIIIIKNAGAILTHPFGSVMRSLLVAIYKLNVQEIMVIGHYDCGMQGIDPAELIKKMLDRNIQSEKIDMINCCGIDLKDWLKGFDDIKVSVVETVNTIRNHPLIPTDVNVYGFIIDPETGKLDNCIEAHANSI